MMVAMLAALVPSVGPARPPRLGGAQDEDSVRAVPRARRRRRALRRRIASRRVSGAVLGGASDCEPRESRAATRAARDGRRRRRGDGSTAPRPRDQSDLVADLVGETGMLPPDKLEDVRARALGGSFSQALIDDGVASSLGIARSLAERFHLPLVDLAVVGVDAEASKAIPLAVLERVCAIPFAFDGDTLRVAITDPQNVRGLDELRLATRHPVEFYVAAEADVADRGPAPHARVGGAERGADRRRRRRRRARAGRGGRPRGRRRDLGRAARPARQLDHLPGRRGGRERRPLRAAGGRARRAVPDRRGAARRAADPEAPRVRRDDPPEGAREARHRRAAQAAGRTHLAERGRRRPSARHPRRDAADGRRRVGDDAPARQVAQRADARGARTLRRDARAALADPRRGRPGRCS